MNWDILITYINHKATEEQTEQVRQWLLRQPENQFLLDYLERRSAQLNAPVKPADIDDQWLRLLDRIFAQPDKKVKPINRYRTLSIAASLLLVSAIGWLYFGRSKAPHPQLVTLQTPANRQGRVMLPDSTEVFLAPNSKLQYDNAFGIAKRNIRLAGEAFFEVKHDAKKPFIVTGQHNLKVTVLGTSFNVYSRPNAGAEVKVATGLVGVTAGNHTQLLKAGEQLVCKLPSQQMQVSAVNIKDAASLQSHILFFKDNNAGEIATKLQRWYNISIEVLPSAYRHPRFSGEMRDAGISNLLKGLNYATGLNYRYKNPNTILLF